MKTEKALTLKTLTKGNVWELQENDIFRLWESAEKDVDLRDNTKHYLDVIKSAFEVEKMLVDKPEVVKKKEALGFKTGMLKMDDARERWAIKKRPILRVTDLTYENIHYISVEKLLEVIDRNFGGGWESLSQSVQDIIESGFDISTTTLPKDRLHKAGGLYQQKVNDGFEVLEIPKGSWVEAIFAKAKPKVEKQRKKFDTEDDLDMLDNLAAKRDAEELDDEDIEENDDKYGDSDDDDTYDEDKLTEESYRTTFEQNPNDLNIDEAEDVADDEGF